MGSDGQVRSGWGEMDEGGCSGGSWLHVPARGKLRVVVLSTAPARYTGHWVNGRMRLCLGLPACGECLSGRGKQKRWCFSVIDAETRGEGLLELGKAPALMVQEAAIAAGRLRGLVLSFGKEGEKLKGRIVVKVEPSMMGAELLPQAEDVEGVLERQWTASEGIQGVMTSVRTRVAT
jgi:hypothetical protein